MITLVAFLLILATVPLFGGRLSLLARLRPDRGWAIGVSVAIQLVIFSPLGVSIPAGIGALLHLLSYGFALAFVQANWRIPGMVLLVSGGLLNLAAITANGGVMPANYDALITAGLAPEGDEFRNSNFVADAKLAFLGDIWAIPQGVPFANVFSIGDVILVIGGGALVHSGCRSQLRRPRSNLRLQTTTYPALDALLTELANGELDVRVPKLVELVDAPRISVSGSTRSPVLEVGLPLLSVITLAEFRALAMRSIVRRNFGASEAFDLAAEHELEATEAAARATSASDLAFALMAQASLRHQRPGPSAVVNQLDHPVEANGPSLADHLAALGIAAPRTIHSVDELFASRVRGQSAVVALMITELIKDAALETYPRPQ